MKRRLLRLILLVLVLSLSACSSNQASSYPSEQCFDDPQALAEYVEASFDEARDIPLFSVSMDMDFAELYDIRLVGNNIYYRYLLNDSTVPDAANGVSVGWNYTKNGIAGLEYFVTSNAEVVSEVEGHEGLYSSDILDDGGKVIGKMLYWVQDDCFFSASVPNALLAAVIDRIGSDPPLAVKMN